MSVIVDNFVPYVRYINNINNIDRQLLTDNKLTKIYLQVPDNYHKAFTDRIKTLTNNRALEIIPIADTEQFYIPYEF